MAEWRGILCNHPQKTDRLRESKTNCKGKGKATGSLGEKATIKSCLKKCRNSPCCVYTRGKKRHSRVQFFMYLYLLRANFNHYIIMCKSNNCFPPIGITTCQKLIQIRLMKGKWHCVIVEGVSCDSGKIRHCIALDQNLPHSTRIMPPPLHSSLRLPLSVSLIHEVRGDVDQYIHWGFSKWIGLRSQVHGHL